MPMRTQTPTKKTTNKLRSINPPTKKGEKMNKKIQQLKNIEQELIKMGYSKKATHRILTWSTPKTN
jgi:hypothetical protein